jgi:hypothetical protein
MTRMEANLKLIEILTRLTYQYPDLRFSQMLFNFGFVKDASKDVMTATGPETTRCWADEYYIESSELVKRIGEQLKKLT